MGLVVTGEKRTQDTHSVCPSGSPIVYLHSPSVFQSLIVLSRLPDTICMGAERAVIQQVKITRRSLTISGMLSLQGCFHGIDLNRGTHQQHFD